jgi:hypothetical protein
MRFYKENLCPIRNYSNFRTSHHLRIWFGNYKNIPRMIFFCVSIHLHATGVWGSHFLNRALRTKKKISSCWIWPRFLLNTLSAASQKHIVLCFFHSNSHESYIWMSQLAVLSYQVLAVRFSYKFIRFSLQDDLLTSQCMKRRPTRTI